MLKNLAKKIILGFSRLEAQIIIRKYRPKIIGITGSVGKTSAKEAIGLVLRRGQFKIRISPKSFNSEIGVPLTILGGDNAWLNPLGWLKNLLEGLSLICFNAEYPDWLVLEIGADRPGDISAFTRWIPLAGAVLTALPERPAHLEFFSSAEALRQEKWQLAAAVPAGAFLVINWDDGHIRQAAESARAKIYSYGFGEEALVRGSDIQYQDGLNFKILHAGRTIPIRNRHLVGRHQIYSLLAAGAVGLALGLDWLTIAEALSDFVPPPGRLRRLAGVNQSLIIDDTYNSSPAALSAALATLAEFPAAGRRIGLLGDMLELGSETAEAHRAAGAEAARVCDLVWTVGVRAEFIAEVAAKKLRAKNLVRHFADARSAAAALRPIIKPGDVILIKGSQAMRLERAVEMLMAEPERKKELLARQEPEWQGKA